MLVAALITSTSSFYTRHKGPHRSFLFFSKAELCHGYIHLCLLFLCTPVPPHNYAGTPAYNGCIEEPLYLILERKCRPIFPPLVGPSWVMPDWPKHLLKGSKGRQSSLVSWQPDSQQPQWWAERALNRQSIQLFSNPSAGFQIGTQINSNTQTLKHDDWQARIKSKENKRH